MTGTCLAAVPMGQHCPILHHLAFYGERLIGAKHCAVLVLQGSSFEPTHCTALNCTCLVKRRDFAASRPGVACNIPELPVLATLTSIPSCAQVQDTLASAWHAAPNLGELDWPTLGGLLGLVLLTSLLTAWASHWVNPVRRQMGTVGARCTHAGSLGFTRAVAGQSCAQC